MIKIINSQITKKERPINFRRYTQKALISQINTTLDTSDIWSSQGDHIHQSVKGVGIK